MGRRFSQQVAQTLRDTFQAALSDPEVADAVRSGRLLRTLVSTGFEPVDLTGVVAAPAVGVENRRSSTKKPIVKKPDDQFGKASARNVMAAKRRAGEAESTMRKAEGALTTIDDKSERVESERDDLAAQLDDLRNQLEQAQQQLTARKNAARGLHETVNLPCAISLTLGSGMRMRARRSTTSVEPR